MCLATTSCRTSSPRRRRGSMPGGSSSWARVRARRPAASSPFTPARHSWASTRARRCSRSARRAELSADLRVQRLEDRTSGRAVRARGRRSSRSIIWQPADKRDLFGRVREELTPGGRFVLADVVVPERPEDAVTPVHRRLRQARHARGPARVARRRRLRDVRGAAWKDLAAIRADLPSVKSGPWTSRRGRSTTARSRTRRPARSTPPIYQTSTFVQEAVGVHKGYDYARVANPTRTALQTALASLENAEHGIAFSSVSARRRR